MEWRGGREGNVEDRRGLGGRTVAAGGGAGAIIVALIGYFVFGINPSTTTAALSQFGGAGSGEQHGTVGTPKDEAGKFVAIVGANINDVWKTHFRNYPEPTIVLYDQGTSTGCGYGQTAMGPFYCPNDSTVYLDLSFWEEMGKLGGSTGDAAKAYVIAHEFGHHIQTLTGASQKVQQAERNARGQGEANKYSVALELQADCYAGVWAKNAAAASNGAVSVSSKDMEDGLKTAQAIGDDTLHKNAGRRVNPEQFTHGTSAQRVQWLQRGYESGDPAQCDTFAGL